MARIHSTTELHSLGINFCSKLKQDSDLKSAPLVMLHFPRPAATYSPVAIPLNAEALVELSVRALACPLSQTLSD